MEPRNEENIKKLAELIKDIKFAMLTTAGAHGDLHSRPMATQKAEFNGELWFFTQKSSGKSSEIQSHASVNVAYATPERQRYISVAGIATIVDDKAKIKELWDPSLKIWFKDGVDDPDICLIKVEPQSVEYWDSPANKLVRFAGFVAARITGNDKFLGENAHVEFH